MKDKISLVNAANQAAVTRDKAKYWLELLGYCLIKEKQKSFVLLGAVVLLKAMRLAIESGLTPSAAEHVKLSYSEKQEPKEPTKALEVPNDAINKMATRIEALEKAVLMLVEENRTLNQRVSGIQAFLMPSAKPAMPMIPWQPEKPKDPLEGLAWYQRAWVQVFEPWKMRKCAS